MLVIIITEAHDYNLVYVKSELKTARLLGVTN
jgi:hypothetical protein